MKNMVTRRVQQIGKKGSFIVSLPKQWCQNHQISSGTELQIAFDLVGDAILFISAVNKSKVQKVEIELPFSPLYEEQTLSRAILGRYLDGFDIIQIVGVPPAGNKKIEARRLIKKLVYKLYGCSLTETVDQFKLQISSEMLSPHNSMQNLFNMTNQMISDSIDAYITHNKELAKDIEERDDEVDKLYFHIVRTLKTLLSDPLLGKNSIDTEEFTLLDSLDLRMVASYLENLGDESENVAKLVQNSVSKPKLPQYLIEEIKSLTKEITRIFERSFHYFQSNDYQKAIDAIGLIKSLQPRILKLQDTPTHIAVIHLLEETLDYIIDLCDLVGQ